MKIVLLLSLIFSSLILAISSSAAPSNDNLSFHLQFGNNGHHTALPVDYLTWCGDCVFTDYTQVPSDCTQNCNWVVNPRDFWPYNLPVQPNEFEPGCMWDSDDYYSYTSSGNVLAAGASVTINECDYLGGFGGPTLLTNVSIKSPSNKLIVTESWTSENNTITATIAPVLDTRSNLWSYFDCIKSPNVYSTKVIVPNSHSDSDDLVVPQLINVTVKNPTRFKVNKTGGVIESGIIAGNTRGCTSWRDP